MSGPYRSAGGPKYRRVKEYLLGQLASERLRAGDATPTEAALAETLQVGRNTVRQALAELSREGIVDRVQGRGTFVRADAPRQPVQSTISFALVVPSVRGSLYPSLIKGFSEAAAAAQHPIHICDTHNDAHVQGDAILELIDMNVGGVAIVPVTGLTPAYQLRQLRAHRIPVVFCHGRSAGLSAPMITWHSESVARRAAEALAGHGHRRVAFVAWLRYARTTTYERAFRDALAEHGIELPAERVCYNDDLVKPPGDDNAHRDLVALLDREDPPTGVFANDIEVAERVYLEAVQLGLRVPEDLSIVTFGGKWRDGAIRERLACFTVDEVEMGHRAAELLDDIHAGRRAPDGQEQIMIPLEFAGGRSLASAADGDTERLAMAAPVAGG